MTEDWPFGDLQPHSFGLILADPPWTFDVRSDRGIAKSPQAHYATMSKGDLMRLPVGKLAAPHCALGMWATQTNLDFAIDLMKRWGFEYKSALSWAKESRSSDPASDPTWTFGTGYWFRSAAEFLLVGSIGNPKICSRSERNLIVARVREHSRKPDEAHEMLERMFPGPRKLELFSRCARPGWSHWGNEVGKFAPGGEA